MEAVAQKFEITGDDLTLLIDNAFSSLLPTDRRVACDLVLAKLVAEGYTTSTTDAKKAMDIAMDLHWKKPVAKLTDAAVVAEVEMQAEIATACENTALVAQFIQKALPAERFHEVHALVANLRFLKLIPQQPVDIKDIHLVLINIFEKKVAEYVLETANASAAAKACFLTPKDAAAIHHQVDDEKLEDKNLSEIAMAIAQDDAVKRYGTPLTQLRDELNTLSRGIRNEVAKWNTYTGKPYDSNR